MVDSLSVCSIDCSTQLRCKKGKLAAARKVLCCYNAFNHTQSPDVLKTPLRHLIFKTMP